MKKFLSLILTIALLSSCDVNTDPIEITASTTIVESVSINIPQSSTSVNFDDTINQDLNDVFTNLNSATAINIDALSYKYTNASGNSGATISSATLVINGITVATITDVNITQASDAGTVFTITDTAILDQIESLLLNTSSVTIQFSGSVNDGPIQFDVQVTAALTASV
ncbi:hypothetical protein AAON49_00765 [Pseudotenacibaculum sp. MALMAid0570]|uniref:hypothetical protein n=1 Tax=Pseudotenacibaculum sp. MALMAid0570 TaxID=3143938 RepID=UPI0032DEF625